jgi:dTMP kinase
MADSSLVYQGYGRGLDKSFITSVNTWAMQGRVPDVTLYIRITPQVAYDRLVARKKALTAIEQEKQEFFERLVHGFDTLYEHRKDVITIDGHNEPHKVFTDAIKSLTPFLQPYLQNS